MPTAEDIVAAIQQGRSSTLWITIVATLVASAVGAYAGAFLKKRAELRAITENLDEALEQLRLQKEITAKIEHGLTAIRAQDLFIRELYGPLISAYSSEQSDSLRQAYLLLFQPNSSSIECEGKSFDTRLTIAINQVMKPLRSNLGVLDKTTSDTIYKVHNELLKLKGCSPEEVAKKKNHIFNMLEVARQLVQLDKLANRIGLIERTLDELREEE